MSGVKNAVVLVLASAILLSGCVNISGMDGEEVIIVELEQGLAIEASDTKYPNILEAMVKGSIYEAGETVSVFATCLDGDDKPVNSTFAVLSSWYPNGSVHLTEQVMVEIQPGYYVYTGPMSAVEGTYLTEAHCRVAGSDPLIEAFAFGEWQNPAWVRRINATQQDVQNISIQIGDIQANITNGFEITWDSLEQINQTILTYGDNITNLITEVGQIAYDSVDRNDSYLVELILALNNTVLYGQNQTGSPVNWTESWSDLYYWETWQLRVDAYDPNSGDRLTYPDVLCSVITTYSGAYIPMTVQGNHFIYEEFINRQGGISWNVSCQFA